MSLAVASRPVASFAPPTLIPRLVPKKTLVRRGFENAYARAQGQWTFANTLQNKNCYTFFVILKSVSEIPKNVATGGLVYAGVAFSANALGIPLLQKGMIWSASQVVGLAGKGIGAGIDRFSAYQWPNAVRVEPAYSQRFQHYGKQIGAAVPTAIFTLMPWIAYPQIKLASVILGLVGANVVYYFFPRYTNTQTFFYFLLSDIPFYHVFTPPRVEVAHYDEKLQYHAEQFFSKQSAADISAGLKEIDAVSDGYKMTLHTISNSSVKAIEGRGLASIRSGYSSFSQAVWVKPILDKAHHFQHAYHERLEVLKEGAEKLILKQLPTTEQSTQRLYQLAFNKITRLVQTEAVKESEIENAVEALEEQYKESIGAKALNEWLEAYEEHKTSEIHLARLERSDFSEQEVIHKTKAGLIASQAKCQALWHKVSLHNNASRVNHAQKTKQEIDKAATAIVTLDAQASDALKRWSAQHGVVQEAEIVLFNMENEAKSNSSEVKTAQEENLLKERTKLNALWSEVELYNDAAVVESVKTLSKSMENDLAKTKNNVMIANQSLEVFNTTLEHKIESILGDFKGTRASYAQKMTDFMLDIQDPLNTWTSEHRKAEYDKAYKHIYEESLYEFEQGSDKRIRRCKRNLRYYAFEEIKQCKPPLPNQKISTKLKNIVNEGFYSLFRCEPFQGIAQHNSSRFNARFFITLAAIGATFGIAAYMGVPISIGLGVGAGGIGLGADIGGTKPLASFGEDAKGPQKTFNQTVQTMSLTTKPLDLPKMTQVPLEGLYHQPAALILPTSHKPLFDFNFERAYVATLPFSSAEQEVEACTRQAIHSQSLTEAKASPKTTASPQPPAPLSCAKRSAAKPTPTPAPVSKPWVSAPITKPPAPTVKPNAAARLLQFNDGNLPESFQAGVMLSTVANTAKEMVHSVGGLISASTEFSKDMHASFDTSLSKESREAAKKRADKKAEALLSGAKKGVDVAFESLSHPVTASQKYREAKAQNANEALENYDKALHQGQGWEAGKALTPVVQDVIEVGTLLTGGAAVAKAGVALGKASIKTAVKAAKPKTSLLAASEKVLEPTAKPPKLSQAAKGEALPDLKGTRTLLPLYDAQKISKTLTPSLCESLPILATTKRATEGMAKTTLTQTALDTGKIIEPKKAPASLFSGPQTAASEVALPELCLPKKEAILFSQNQKLSDLSVGLPPKATPFKITPSSVPNMTAAVAQLSQEAAAQQAHKLRFLPALQEIFKSYEFRTPITYDFEASRGRLNCGFPIDLIKVQKPIKKKIPQLAPSGSELARPHKLYPHIICESGKMYMPTSKHMPLKNGQALGGADASVNPIPSYEIGQKLLDTAYARPGKKQFYNYYEGDVIEFQPGNFNNEWHAYAIRKNIGNQTGNVVKQFEKDGLIDKSERGKILGK